MMSPRRVCAAPHFTRALQQLALAAILAAMPDLARAAPGDTELVSIDPLTGGAGGGAFSFQLESDKSVSADGRYVVYWWNGQYLLRDRLAGSTEVLAPAPAEAGASWFSPSMSADARFIAFVSAAANLVPLDTNGLTDAFVRDRATGFIERISVSSEGVQANGWSHGISISGDGRFVLFQSNASNLVPGDPSGNEEIFLRDRLLRTTRRYSVSDSMDSYSFRPMISDDASFLAFSSTEPWTINGVLINRSTEQLWFVARAGGTTDSEFWLSSDAGYMTWWSRHWVGGTEIRDVYLDDRHYSTEMAELISVATDGGQANDDSVLSSVSADGRFVAFQSLASNLVQGDTNGMADVFVRDRQLQRTWRVSVNSSGAQSNGHSGAPVISADGRFVAFQSSASNLVANDSNGQLDIFIHELEGAPVPDVISYYLRPFLIEYGQLQLGTSIKKGFTLKNTGSTPLSINTVELLGVDRSQYVLRSFCVSPLAAGSRCWISVAFRPTSTGYKKANLHVVAGGIDRHRALRGTGVN